MVEKDYETALQKIPTGFRHSARLDALLPSLQRRFVITLKGGSSARTRMRRSILKTYAAAALSVSLLSSPALADNWLALRGAEGSVMCWKRTLPLRWSTNENVRWRGALPDRGNSTPIVWKEQIFITQA